MLIGSTPTDFTLQKYNGGTAQLLLSTGKVILVSFFDIINGWDWLSKLVEIQNDPAIVGISSDVQIIAIVYNYLDAGSETVNSIPYTGPITKNWITDKITATGIVGITFPVLVNGAWASSYASQYRDGFLTAVDPNFSGSPNNYLFSYKISKDYLISDKWNRNGTANNNPISFNRIIIPATPAFNSNDLTNTRSYVIQRILNLNAAPTILYTDPADAITIANITDIQPIEVVFSKPVVAAAGISGSYTPGGAGGSGLTVGASYTGADKIENMATLTIGGVLAEGAVTITLGAAITDTAGAALADNQISYTADVADPTIESIASTTLNDTYHAGETINIEVNFSESVTLAGGNLNVTLDTGAVVQVTAGAYPASQFSGTYTVLAGHNSTDLNVTSIALSGGTLRDAVGHNADLSLPAGENLADNNSIVIDTAAPAGYSVSIDQASVDAGNQTAVNFTFAGAEVGATYHYSIDDTNGATSPVTGSGTISAANQQITGINVSTLDDDTLTLTVYLTDGEGNQGANATDTVTKDTGVAVIDVYVRDSLGDTGAVPSGGGCFSPDIILSPSIVADPATTFPDINSDYGTTNAEIGNDNYVYIRVLNRTNAPCDVTARLYYAYLGTTCGPDQWHLITTVGDIAINGVPALGSKISGTITWNPPDPAPLGYDHFCLIAEVSNATEAYPDNSGIVDASTYINFISMNNNVAYKNLTFQNEVGDSKSSKKFSINGFKKEYRSDLEIDVRKIGKAGQAAIKVDNAMFKQEVPEFVNMKEDIQRRTDKFRWYNIEPGKIGIIKNFVMPAHEKYFSEIEVKVFKDIKEQQIVIPVLQKSKGKLMGAVNVIVNVIRLERAKFIGVKTNHLVHRNGCKCLAKVKRDDMAPYMTLLEARTDGFDWALDCLNKPFTAKDVSGRIRLKILKYINNVKSYQELQKKVKDTPGIGYSKDKYSETDKKGIGLTETTAREIIRQRDRLGKYTRLEQVDKVVGMGQDTFIDLVNSFKEGDAPAKAVKAVKSKKKAKPAKVKKALKKAKAKTVKKTKKPAKAKKTVKPIKPAKTKKPVKQAKISHGFNRGTGTKAAKPVKPIKVKKTVKKAKAKRLAKPVKQVKAKKQAKTVPAAHGFNRGTKGKVKKMAGAMKPALKTKKVKKVKKPIKKK